MQETQICNHSEAMGSFLSALKSLTHPLPGQLFWSAQRLLLYCWDLRRCPRPEAHLRDSYQRVTALTFVLLSNAILLIHANRFAALFRLD